jgi:hypothetical protein
MDDIPPSMAVPLRTRRAPRPGASLPVELVIAGQPHGTVAAQLSFGGAFIASPERPACGSRVELRFVVPQPHALIEIGGVVRWRDGRGFGVQFDGLRAGAVWSIGKWMARG